MRVFYFVRQLYLSTTTPSPRLEGFFICLLPTTTPAPPFLATTTSRNPHFEGWCSFFATSPPFHDTTTHATFISRVGELFPDTTTSRHLPTLFSRVGVFVCWTTTPRLHPTLILRVGVLFLATTTPPRPHDLTQPSFRGLACLFVGRRHHDFTQPSFRGLVCFFLPPRPHHDLTTSPNPPFEGWRVRLLDDDTTTSPNPLFEGWRAYPLPPRHPTLFSRVGVFLRSFFLGTASPFPLLEGLCVFFSRRQSLRSLPHPHPFFFWRALFFSAFFFFFFSRFFFCAHIFGRDLFLFRNKILIKL